MTRKTIVLGLALLALCAIAATVPAAAAANGALGSNEAEEEPYPLTLTGNQTTKHVFTNGKEAITCTTVKFSGVLAKLSEEVTLTPSYSGCEYKGLAVDINLHGCDYVLREISLLFPSNLDVKCPVGAAPVAEVTFSKTPICTITITPWAGRVAMLTNLAGPPEDVGIAISLKFVFVRKADLANGCLGEPTGEEEVGEYTGQMTLSADTAKGKPHGLVVQ